MSDRTSFQCHIYACPEDQRQAAAEVMDGEWEEGGNGERYAITDDTLNEQGKPIRAGQAAKVLSTFATEAEAQAHIAALPGSEDGRYGIEAVPSVNLDEPYTDYEISCGSADEYAGNLIKAAPGCSFVLWEDPAYQWLGDIRAYTPELGLFAGICDSDGQVVAYLNDVTAAIAAGTLERNYGKPWLDDWHDHITALVAASGRETGQ